MRREGGGDPGPIFNRAQLGNDHAAVGPFAGRISFDVDTDTDGVNDSPEMLDAYWHYDHTTPIAAGNYDLYTVALHEILHTLGIGIGETWSQLRTGSTANWNWNGAHARAFNGGSGENLLSIDGMHIADAFVRTRITDGVSQAAAVARAVQSGERLFLAADLAFLQDIGYALAPTYAAGDFHEDGFVNGADLTNWTGGFGRPTGATHVQGDADTDGADFLVWEQQLGNPSSLGSATLIPKPAAAILCVSCACLLRSGPQRRCT